MELQQLFKKLCAQTPDKRQFVWLYDIDDETPSTETEAFLTIANAKCAIEDKICVRDNWVYVGTTTDLAKQLSLFTAEEIDSKWSEVCLSIDTFRAMVYGE